MTRFILPLIIIFTTLFSSCTDEIYNPYEIGEGEAKVQATVTYIPLITSKISDDESRTAGDAIRNIRNIQFVIYDYKDNFIRKEYFEEKNNPDDLGFTPGTNYGMPDGIPDKEENGNKVQSEASTATATVTLPNLPYGRYKIYVVANYDKLTDDQVESPAILKRQIATWQEDVSENDQMFGCLATDNKSEYADAPEIIINKSNVQLQGWMKRLASKLTIVYDGEELHQGIYIYIQKVSLRDIPKTCTLGFNESDLTEEQKKDLVNGNSPQSPDDLIDKPAKSTLYYTTDENGVVTTSTEDPQKSDPTSWLVINKDVQGNNILGAIETDENGKPVYGEDNKVKTHPETAEALYFYENCQGNYEDFPDKKKYDKQPKPEDIGKDQYYGKDEDNDGKPDNFRDSYKDDIGVYKDNVPYGTYIEVEGYYRSTNPENQSQGPIKYRFMLGQNNTYDYNALRNRHYKLFLKFKGYANQPEWHIVYEEVQPGLYPPEYFYVSYSYNTRHQMPIRMTGKPKRVTLQIIENNWAPYDPEQPDEVAPKSTGTGDMRFQWYRELYKQEGFDEATYGLVSGGGLIPQDIKDFLKTDLTRYPSNGVTRGMLVENLNIKPTGGYHFGLHAFSDYRNIYEPAIPDEYQPEKITHPWVGFLALQVPVAYNDMSDTDDGTILPTGVQDDQNEDNYWKSDTYNGVRDYYLGKGGKDSFGNINNTTPLYQCTYDFSNTVIGETDVPVLSKKNETTSEYNGTLPTGRNAGKIRSNGDGSYTLTVPLYTQPKELGYISGFSGNNPYEGYRRRAKVLITATYDVNGREVPLREVIPIYQVRRVVNPKAIWRNITKDNFHVVLMDHASPQATTFIPIESEDEWIAWIATPGNEQQPYTGTDFEIFGGVKKEGGKIYGNTGSKVEFDIKFGTVGTNESKCGKVIVKYHGNNCEHGIYLRNGYNEPLEVATATSDYPNPCKWSSYSVYEFHNGPTITYQNGGATGSANPPAEIENLSATLTVNPLALGTLYKRGNYDKGIRILNNAPEYYPFLTPIADKPLWLIPADLPGDLQNPNTDGRPIWDNIWGITVKGGSSGYDHEHLKVTWTWSQFKVDVNGETRTYDIPEYKDFEALRKEDFGIGVLYGDGAEETAETLADAYQYFNTGNTLDQRESEKGMRGIIVYNKSNLHQVFFPIGYSGVGRRTVQNCPTADDNGYLRYSSVPYKLSTATAMNNQYRPVAYNMPAAPGAIYWTKNVEDLNNNRNYLVAWDINYFDLNFNGYDYAASQEPNGDALIIKPVMR